MMILHCSSFATRDEFNKFEYLDPICRKWRAGKKYRP